MVAMDTSVVPLGERAWAAILQHVIERGDAAETTYLEVKGPFDLTSGADLVKIAKFLLGMANRTVDTAARHFQGHGVMVLGAEHGRAVGVQRVLEPHEIANRLQPYLGHMFPGYEFGRIPVGHDRDVLFVIGSPPRRARGLTRAIRPSRDRKGRAASPTVRSTYGRRLRPGRRERARS